MRIPSTHRPIAMCLAWGMWLWAGLFGDTRAADPAAAPHMERYVPTAEELQASYQRAQAGPPQTRVHKTQMEPHWFHDSSRFWYRNDLARGAHEFILIDAEAGRREPAFDHKKLAAALSKAAGKEYTADHLPFDVIDFIDADKAIRFTIDKTTWKCELSSYECVKSDAKPQPTPAGAPAEDNAYLARLESPWPDGLAPDADERTAFQQPQPRPRPPADSLASPDKTGLSAFIKDSNIYLRDKDGNDTLLTLDGKAGSSYGLLSWSPDAKWLAAFRIERAEPKPVYLIQSSPSGGGRAQLRTRGYMLPGDKFTSYQPILFNVADRKQITPEVESAELEYGTPPVHWKKDGNSCTFTYQKEDRGHQRFRLIEVDPATGKSRNLIDEKTQTFIWTAHTEGVNVRPVTWVNDGKEIIYTSERDGWRHLYLIDARDGTLKNQITKGPYVVRGIDRIDEDKRQVWFRASGMNEDQDPYFNHYYHINFDGSGLVALTEGNGDHFQGRGPRGPRKPGQGPPPGLQFSPDRRFYIDTYSRVDMAPVHELRRSSDGHLVCKLEEADISELKSSGWEPPEVFVAKGRDGTTDIWGMICRPAKFDPNKKYPVIEYIYAGPHGSHVPKTFAPMRRFASLTELGFIVVQIDGMGTANRSRAFHDVCWHNLKDAGFPDRILWHKAAAAKYPYYDISRVGIYGTSAGGQNSTGALLFHGDFYKAAVSACGCHDNRMDKASWNEQWMGYPVGPQYAESSNIDHARNLTGKLLLIVGELDTNVPPESTLRLVDALIKANKDFELLVMPGLDHTSGGAYGNRRLQDFFVRHLHGVTPPDRNAAPRQSGT